mmetsp:Transcript_3069/g.5591  ORF Transcript_3069/g.5591 Transcript_3069/m.5591 type:complete len:100 (-) Transcript_3069:1583-1882(-)
MAASLKKLATKTFPFVQGGAANGGFEYLGLDFILSYNEHQEPRCVLAGSQCSAFPRYFHWTAPCGSLARCCLERFDSAVDTSACREEARREAGWMAVCV